MFIATVFVGQTACQVSLNVPEYVLQGGKATLECRISAFSSTIDEATIERRFGSSPMSSTRQPLATNRGIDEDAPDKMELSVSKLPDGTYRMILTINDISREDAAFYTCSAGRQLPTGFISLGSEMSYLAVLFPPSTDYPSCSLIPQDGSLDKEVGDILEMSCTSELANPNVNLVWGRTGVGVIPEPTEYISSNILRSEISITVTKDDDKAYFVCITKSAAFSNYAESCVVGPISLQTEQGSEPSTESMNVSDPSEWQTEASSSCITSYEDYLMLNLKSPVVISGLSAGVVIILILLTIICVLCLVYCCQCCKHCCKKEKKVDGDEESNEPKEISLVSLPIKKSKENLYEPNSKDEVTPPPKYCTLPVGAKTMETCLTTTSEDSKPKILFTTPKTKAKKEYPPPPDYPRPLKGMSLHLPAKDYSKESQLGSSDVVVYGNVKPMKKVDGIDSNESQIKDTDNDNTITRNRPKSTPNFRRQFGDSLEKSPKVNGGSQEDSEVAAYGNLDLNSLTRKSTRASPTPIRPSKAPPPPPASDQNDSDQDFSNDNFTDGQSDMKCSNHSINKL